MNYLEMIFPVENDRYDDDSCASTLFMPRGDNALNR